MPSAFAGPEFITEDFSGSGNWWLPDRPDHSVAGNLDYVHGEKFTLTVIGNLSSLATFADGPVTIYGSFQGKQITLFSCFQTQSNLSWATYGHAQETYASYGAFIGLQTLEGLDYKVNNITYRTMRTPSLLNGPQFNFIRNDDEIGMTLSVPRYQEIEIKSEAKLKLQCLTQFQSGNFSKKINLDSAWTIETTEYISIQAMFDKYVNPLVLLSTISNNAEDYLIGVEARSNNEPRQSFKIYNFVYSKNLDIERVRPHEQFFNLSNYDIFPDIANKWLCLYKLQRDAFNQFFANRYHSSPLGEDGFLRIIRAVENWEDAKLSTLRVGGDSEFSRLLKKLREIFSVEEINILGGLPTGRDVLVSKIISFCSNLPEPLEHVMSIWPNFISRTKETRNAITHSVPKKNAFKGLELAIATDLLELIFKVKVMLVLGVAEESIEKFLQNSQELRYIVSNIQNNLGFRSN